MTLIGITYDIHQQLHSQVTDSHTDFGAVMDIQRTCTLQCQSK